MFHIGNVQILTPEIEVLQELKSQLAINGINLFNKFIETENHIQFNCPSHKGGQERKPSCGITKNDIIQDLGNGRKKVIEAGTVHCFQCGYTTSLPEMISDCFGKNDGGLFGIKWLSENFITQSIENRKPIQFNMKRNVNTNKHIQYVSEEELDSYRYFHPYMYQRKLTDEVIERFDVGYDKDFVLKSKTTGQEKHLECITFPVRDITGKTLFIARRCIHNKIFHYPDGVIKPLYGIYELYQLEEFPKEVYVCESIIDALTLWTHKDKYAVAMNGLGTALQFEQLSNLPCRKIILATDSDEKGMEARSRIRNNVKNKFFAEIILPPGRKDINECDFDELENPNISNCF